MSDYQDNRENESRSSRDSRHRSLYGAGDVSRYRNAQQRQRRQTRQPRQGTWYENQDGSPQYNRRTRKLSDNTEAHESVRRQEAPARQRQQRPQQGRANDPQRTERRMAQQRRSSHSPYYQQQLDRHAAASRNYQHQQGMSSRGASALQSIAGSGGQTALYIRIALVAILLIVLIVRFTTFGGGAELTSLNAQVNEQQTQLQTLTDENGSLQSQADSRQSTIDAYNEKVAASS